MELQLSPRMVPFTWHGYSGLVQMEARPANCELVKPLAWFGASDLIEAPFSWCKYLWPGGSASGSVDMPLAWWYCIWYGAHVHWGRLKPIMALQA